MAGSLLCSPWRLDGSLDDGVRRKRQMRCLLSTEPPGARQKLFNFFEVLSSLHRTRNVGVFQSASRLKASTSTSTENYDHNDKVFMILSSMGESVLYRL